MPRKSLSKVEKHLADSTLMVQIKCQVYPGETSNGQKDQANDLPCRGTMKVTVKGRVLPTRISPSQWWKHNQSISRPDVSLDIQSLSAFSFGNAESGPDHQVTSRKEKRFVLRCFRWKYFQKAKICVLRVIPIREIWSVVVPRLGTLRNIFRSRQFRDLPPDL